MSNDPFAKVPEFLAAFNNIRTNGFFSHIEFKAGSPGMEEMMLHCGIVAEGYVPNSKKYFAPGCGAIINPEKIIASCKEMCKTRKIKHVEVKVETENWKLWDKKEENVIGSKGTQTKLYIFIHFES
jgi:hypothetical protein